MKTKQAIQVRKDDAHQNFQELLHSITKISSHIMQDNETSIQTDSDFPLEIRKRQIQSLDVLLAAIEDTMTIIEFTIDSEEGSQNEVDR